MKKSFLFLVAASVLVVACQKQNPEAKKGDINFTATMEQQADNTKSTLIDGITVKWTAGDEVCAYHWNSGTVTYAGFTASTTGVSSQFTLNTGHQEGLTDLANGDIIIYPFHEGNTLANTLVNDHTVTFTTSVDQTYVSSSFPAGANVAVGVYNNGLVNFKNVFGVLKLSLKGSNRIQTIKIEDNDGINLTGDFSVDVSNPDSPTFTQTGGSSYISLNCGTGGVKLNTTTSTDFYIVVPTGAFAHGFTATLTPVSGETIINPVITTNRSNIINRSHVRAMPSKGIIMFNDDLLNGLFTINTDGDQVRFTKGNLQATIDADLIPIAWGFAADQLSYIGNTNANRLLSAGVIDLFNYPSNGVGAGSGYKPYGINTSTDIDDYAGAFVDLGNRVSTSTITYRTLYQNEFIYLMDTRSDSEAPCIGSEMNARYAQVVVDGKKGVLLFSDDFTWNNETMGAAPLTFNTFCSDYNTISCGLPSAGYTQEQFYFIEKAGGVFLVHAGCCQNDPTGDFTPYTYGSYMNYLDNDSSYGRVASRDSGVFSYGTVSKIGRSSVRLVSNN